MSYRWTPGTPHGLAHNPFKACVAPRPIAWVTSLSKTGVVNLAPFSFYNAFAEDPPIVALGINGSKPDGTLKDTLKNIRELPQFVVHMPRFEEREIMNESSAPLGAKESEAEHLGLSLIPSDTLSVPRLRNAAIALECSAFHRVELPGGRSHMVLGRVQRLHIADEFIREGRVDIAAIRPLSRLGYKDYASVDSVFEMDRPGKR